MQHTRVTLVTGAAGFLGRHLVRRLVNDGVRVRATAPPWEDCSALAASGVECIAADLRDPQTLPPLFDGGVERVFHLGAICNFSTPYSTLHRVNVQGVEQLTDLALRNEVRAFVYVGSTSVYGAYRGVPFTEDTPRNPQDDYGRSKRDGEDVVWRRVREGLPATVLRPCTVYGPGCTDGAGKVFSRPTSIGAIPGSGRQLLANVRVEDVAAAALYLSERQDTVGRAYNLADDSRVTLGEALTLAAEAFGRRPPRLRLPLSLVAAAARLQGWTARLSGRIPDLELDAVRYLSEDYVVDTARLKATGYRLLYPDFAESMRELGRRHRTGETR